MDTRLIDLMQKEKEYGISNHTIRVRALAREKEIYEIAKTIIPHLANNGPEVASEQAYRGAELLYLSHKENEKKINEFNV